MTKFINKSDVVFNKGFFRMGPDIVSPSYRVCYQLEDLDLWYQQALYLSNQDAAKDAPSLEGFVRETFNSGWSDIAKPETPIMDARVAESLAFLAENESVDEVARANDFIRRNFADLMDFCADDEYIVCSDGDRRVQCAKIGDPLKLTCKEIQDMVITCIKAGTLPVDKKSVTCDCGF